MKWDDLRGRCDGISSRPSRGAWIEMEAIENGNSVYVSRPSRGAWIEIRNWPQAWARSFPVAPLAGRVD